MHLNSLFIRPRLLCLGLCGCLFFPDLFCAVEIPAGTPMELRLLAPVSSFSAREGDPVSALLIAPVRIQDRLVLPLNLAVEGKVSHVHPVRWGTWHETAYLQLAFGRIRLPDGRVLSFESRVAEVENAREKVDTAGGIRGIRSTATPGYRFLNFIGSLAMLDPIAYLYTNVAGRSLIPFSQPDIILPAGTELWIKTVSPVSVDPPAEATRPPVAASPEEQRELARIVAALPFRTATQGKEIPSDLTSLLIIASRPALTAALAAAGWLEADRLSSRTEFRVIQSMAEDQGYRQAPMSVLLLGGKPPDLAYSKTLNTFARRHHMRLWEQPVPWRSQPVFTASATQDIGVAVSREKKNFIHLIDENIDNERAKVVNDLQLTGCVDALQMVDRPWIPKAAKNATGDRLLTDGAIAVIRLNDCLSPRKPGTPIPKTAPVEPAAVQRGFRQGILILRNDLLRSNIVWQGAMGVRFLARKISPPPRTGKEPRTIAMEGALYLPPSEEIASIFHTATPAVANSRDTGIAPAPLSGREKGRIWDAPYYELELLGGRSRYGKNILDIMQLDYRPGDPAVQGFTIDTTSRLQESWAAGLSLTISRSRFISHEISYTLQHGRYSMAFSSPGDPGGEPLAVTQSTGLVTRQFQYDLQLRLRSREKRVQPYVAAGPVVQLIHLTDHPFQKARGIFRYGLHYIGWLEAAYNFHNEPPLNGGGIYQLAAQYGGGIKLRLHPHWTLRFDFRETVGPHPNLFEGSLEPGHSATDVGTFDVRRLTDPGLFRQQRFTVGTAFTF